VLVYSLIGLVPFFATFDVVADISPTENRSLGKPKRRWEYNIRMDLKEICINTRNWVDSAEVGIIGEHL
jgi:hypothetical protein